MAGERRIPKDRGPVVLWLAIIWLVAVTAHMIWGSITGRGLYGLLADWLTQASGSYGGTLVFVGPLILLGLPSIWYLFGQLARVDAETKRDPAAQKRYVRRWITGILILGGLLFLGAIGALLTGLAMPDGSETPVEVTRAELERGTIPDGRVLIRGRLDPAVRAGTVERNRTGDRRDAYIGFRFADGPKDGPVRLFVLSGLDEDPAAIAAFPPDVTGYLYEDALPTFATGIFRRQGIAVAEPHFVLEQSPEARRTGWFTLFGVCFFFAFCCAFIGGTLLVLKAGPRRV